MPLAGRHGVFIHIPKTGGTWTKRVLRQRDSASQRDTHGLPLEFDMSGKTFYFASVRHPALWLRSIWRNRLGEEWKPYPSQTIMWSKFCRIISPLGSSDFNEFAWNVTATVPGILTWLLRIYTPPPVRVIRLEDMAEFLSSLGYDPNVKVPNPATDLPEIDRDMYFRIQDAESELYLRYGYSTFGPTLH